LQLNANYPATDMKYILLWHSETDLNRRIMYMAIPWLCKYSGYCWATQGSNYTSHWGSV